MKELQEELINLCYKVCRKIGSKNVARLLQHKKIILQTKEELLTLVSLFNYVNNVVS